MAIDLSQIINEMRGKQKTEKASATEQDQNIDPNDLEAQIAAAQAQHQARQSDMPPQQPGQNQPAESTPSSGDGFFKKYYNKTKSSLGRGYNWTKKKSSNGYNWIKQKTGNGYNWVKNHNPAGYVKNKYKQFDKNDGRRFLKSYAVCDLAYRIPWTIAATALLGPVGLAAALWPPGCTTIGASVAGVYTIRKAKKEGRTQNPA